MTHPDPACNEAQDKFLAECSPETRRHHELMFTIGNATFRYHMEAKKFNPTEADWNEWLEGLPVSMAIHMRNEGFEDGKRVLSFTRYIMEKNDVGLEEYLRKNVDPKIYQEYLSLMAK
jgi:hypothetical protein